VAQGRGVPDQRGFEMQAMWSRKGQLEALFDLGEWDEVLEISERVIRWDESRGDQAYLRELVDELIAETEAHQNYRVQYLSEIVRMHLACGGTLESARAVMAEASEDHTEALLLFDRAAEGRRDYGFGLVYALSLLGAARALGSLGRDDEARGRLQTARAILRSIEASHLVNDVEVLLGSPGVA
jgi:tetratricopeptide (TPR) repeat protein